MPDEPRDWPACPFCGGEVRRDWHIARLECRECGWTFTPPSSVRLTSWTPEAVEAAWRATRSLLTELDALRAERDAARAGASAPNDNLC